jgi:hypothetical protein
MIRRIEDEAEIAALNATLLLGLELFLKQGTKQSEKESQTRGISAK